MCFRLASKSTTLNDFELQPNVLGILCVISQIWEPTTRVNEMNEDRSVLSTTEL